MVLHLPLEWNRGHRPALWHEKGWLYGRKFPSGRTCRLWKGFTSESVGFISKSIWNPYSLIYLLLFFRMRNRKIHLITSPVPIFNDLSNPTHSHCNEGTGNKSSPPLIMKKRLTMENRKLSIHIWWMLLERNLKWEGKKLISGVWEWAVDRREKDTRSSDLGGTEGGLDSSD